MHKKGTNNKVMDALSRRLLTMQEVKLKSIGLDGFKYLYEEDPDYSEDYNVCIDVSNHFHSDFVEYTL